MFYLSYAFLTLKYFKMFLKEITYLFFLNRQCNVVCMHCNIAQYSTMLVSLIFYDLKMNCLWNVPYMEFLYSLLLLKVMFDQEKEKLDL